MTGPRPRERMVQSAALLLMERGVAGTGMREIAEHASAPRGSLQHYFPDGKDQVLVEALTWIGDEITASVTRQLDGPDPLTVRAIVGKQFGRWRRILLDTDFLAGCPVMATLSDAAADEQLRSAAAGAFDRWQQVLAKAFRAAGLSTSQARRAALVLISSLEGGIALARARRSIEPLEALGREIERLLAGFGPS